MTSHRLPETEQQHGDSLTNSENTRKQHLTKLLLKTSTCRMSPTYGTASSKEGLNTESQCTHKARLGSPLNDLLLLW